MYINRYFPPKNDIKGQYSAIKTDFSLSRINSLRGGQNYAASYFYYNYAFIFRLIRT